VHAQPYGTKAKQQEREKKKKNGGKKKKKKGKIIATHAGGQGDKTNAGLTGEAK